MKPSGTPTPAEVKTYTAFVTSELSGLLAELAVWSPYRDQTITVNSRGLPTITISADWDEDDIPLERLQVVSKETTRAAQHAEELTR